MGLIQALHIGPLWEHGGLDGGLLLIQHAIIYTNTPASNTFICTHPRLVSTTTTCFTHTSSPSATAASTALLAKDAAAVPAGTTTAKPTTVVVEVEVAVVSSVPLSPYEFQNGSAGDVAVEAAAVHSQNRKFTIRNREWLDYVC